MSSTIYNLAEGLTIFQKYDDPNYVMAEHDIIYAGPNPAIVSEEDHARLKALGWVYDESLENFQLNV